MPDYERKAKVIRNGLVKQIKEIQRLRFENIGNDFGSEKSYELLFLEAEFGEDYHEAVRVAKADYQRVVRLRRRINCFIHHGNCLFLTLTFRDDVLASTSPGTRKAYVRRFLKSQSKYYVGNIDFGDQTEREHYHAIIIKDRIDLESWKYGFIFAQKIIKSSRPLKLARYISKLTNHAIKESTKQNRLIYSRDIPHRLCKGLET